MIISSIILIIFNFLFSSQEGVLLMEMLEMAPSREAVTMVCYVLPMGNAWVCLKYFVIVIFPEKSNLISIFISPIYILKMIVMIAECITNTACSEDKPVCVAGSCKGTKEIVT